MTDTEAVTAFDLEAYVDGQLDPQRRFEVEDHLARNPEAAAQVMADMRARDALRLLAAAPLGPPPADQLEAMGRLKGGLRRAGRVRELGRIAAAVVLVLTGVVVGRVIPWQAQPQAVASDFVAEAVAAHRTSLMRAAMGSQPEAIYYNPGEIRSATRIALPTLPAAWQVTDVQVFPSDDGPTVAMALETEELGTVSLFAARSPEFADREPETVETRSGPVAYWQIGDLAYALTGAVPSGELQAAAAMLSHARYDRPGKTRPVSLAEPPAVRQ